MRANFLLRFGARFGLSFALFAALWVAAAPAYNALVFAGANGALQLDDPRVAEIGTDDGQCVAFHLNGAEREASFVFDRYGTFFNVVLLLALLWATPRLSWRARLLRSALAIATLGFVQVLFVVVQIKAQFVNAGLLYMPNQTAYMLNWVAVLMGTLGEKLFPLLIVAALSWRAWYQSLDTQRARTPHSAKLTRKATQP